MNSTGPLVVANGNDENDGLVYPKQRVLSFEGKQNFHQRDEKRLMLQIQN